MSGGRLEGRRVAVIATDGVEQSELIEPREALEDAGATTVLIGPRLGSITAYRHDQKGKEIQVDRALSAANADDFDAVMLPGGVVNADRIRANQHAVAFLGAMAAAGKPIAAICHAPWLLIEAKVARGRTLTSWPSLRTDLENAGATWVDREVVVDIGLITSRKPEDIPAFNEKMIDAFASAYPRSPRDSSAMHATVGAGRSARYGLGRGSSFGIGSDAYERQTEAGNPG